MRNATLLTIFTTVLFVWGKTLIAGDFRSGNYKHSKKIQFSSGNKQSSWGKIELDEEVYRSSFFHDLRIIHDGNVVPYKRSLKYERIGQMGFVTPRIIFDRTEDNKRTYLLEIPSIPNGRVMDNLGVYSQVNYESQVKVYLGNEIDQWKDVRNLFLYKYDSSDYTSNSNIKLNTGYYRYIRLELTGTEKLDFPKLYFGPEERKAEMVFPQELPSPNSDGDLQATIFYLTNEQSLPYRAIRFDFEESDYRRRYELYSMGEHKEYRFLASGTFHRDKKQSIDFNEIHVNQTQTGAWKLVIYNEDNPAITLKSVNLVHPREILEFPLTDIDPGSKELSLKLLYGFKYAKSANFDLTGFPGQGNVSYAEFSLGEEKANPDFGYSLFHPPLSVWVIRFLFIVGVGGVGYLSFRVFRRWNQLQA